MIRKLLHNMPPLFRIKCVRSIRMEEEMARSIQGETMQMDLSQSAKVPHLK